MKKKTKRDKVYNILERGFETFPSYYSDGQPLFARRHPIMYQGIDITQIPELISMHDSVLKEACKLFGVVWNTDENYYEGQLLDPVFELVGSFINLKVIEYLNEKENNKK